ncbi:hypothetical protein [Shewanella sp. 10N.286.48.A6]|uniref:hypothetical protein n=1 Tax=Shewanella sp. 10N.286.48.A6 TaxID=1880833 RepID=UPI000C851B59|nr:hypothetical protein [Shewanella sp. 10N.286.48.A6]PMH97200.1 hypothetical protein BCU55_18090 [Shewanella sp. 10N.286.48.A6]
MNQGGDKHLTQGLAANTNFEPGASGNSTGLNGTQVSHGQLYINASRQESAVEVIDFCDHVVMLQTVNATSTEVTSTEVTSTEVTSTEIMSTDVIKAQTLPLICGLIDNQNNQGRFLKQNSDNEFKKILTSPSSIIVAGLHVVLVFMLFSLADNTISHFVEISREQAVKAATSESNNQEIKAYFLTAEQITQLAKTLPSEQALIEEVVSEVITNEEIIDQTISNKQSTNKVVDTSSIAPAVATSPKDTVNQKAISPKPIDQKDIDQKAVNQKPIDYKPIIEKLPIAEAVQAETHQFDWSSVDSMYLQQQKDSSNEHLFKPQLFNETISKANTITSDNLSAINQASHSFINKLNQQQVNQQISQQAHLATSVSGASTSELTPEMDDIELIVIEDKRQPTTLNHRLDPNRIVKIGETCHRLVALPTQINPYAEGLDLGHPCEGGKTKKALDNAIQQRLSKLKLP